MKIVGLITKILTEGNLEDFKTFLERYEEFSNIKDEEEMKEKIKEISPNLLEIYKEFEEIPNEEREQFEKEVKMLQNKTQKLSRRFENDLVSEKELEILSKKTPEEFLDFLSEK